MFIACKENLVIFRFFFYHLSSDLSNNQIRVLHKDVFKELASLRVL
jgi:hypothetical protein